MTDEVTIKTEPPGADVSLRPYRSDISAWESLGKTPLENVRVPKDGYVYRIEQAGFTPMTLIDGCLVTSKPGSICPVEWSLNLRPEGSVPSEMVPVPGGETGLGWPVGQAPSAELDDFLIDRHEVTNGDYRKFVEAGGYRKRDFWKEPFVKDGREIPWEEAVALLVDGTGRPGPSTWEVGSYPKGLEKHPVAGVSWYEAAAYAEFAGKSLPTAYHWTWASEAWFFTALIYSGSNFQSDGTRPVAEAGTLSGYGTTDMAGNVKEWCRNEGADGKRFILGGGFGEPTYMFLQADSQDPWERRPNYGFRCARLDAPPTETAAARIEATYPDFSRTEPVSDEVFDVYRGLYAYDETALNPRVEETETTESWTYEAVSFDAAYGGERVLAHVFLPRVASPPFQAVVFFPGAIALMEEKFIPSSIEGTIDFLVRSGRALVFPIYKGLYERRDGSAPGKMPPGSIRDHTILWSKDLGRTLDYLETRRDIDVTKLAYEGFSMGAHRAPIFLAIENRFRAAVLSAGGFMLRNDLPEAHAPHFAPQVTMPVLMLNGRYDDTFPLEASQLPLFHLLGTADGDKKHVVYEAGHGDFPRKEEIRETLDWLDKYLGPVRRN
jgi:formylglycine-generating enzyme required for sulfatase activity/dienelactone hydrolase